MRNNVEKQLAADWETYKYEFDICIREAPVLETKELVFSDRPTLAVTSNGSTMTNNAPENYLMLRTDGRGHIINV